MNFSALSFACVAALLFLGCASEPDDLAGTPTSTGSGTPGAPTTAESLAIQQAEHGWGSGACPPAPEGVSVGYDIGEQLGELTVFDCEGNAVSLAEICGADVTWLFFAHAWCPHCKKGGAQSEALADGFGDANLAAVNVVVDDANHEPPDGADCQAWRDSYGQHDVLTFYDPDGATLVLWDESYTALNVFLDGDRVIRDKMHTDVEGQIESTIASLLP